ncbi:hypothetical protein [Peterkaempfera sp. SMS 1(5)a]
MYAEQIARARTAGLRRQADAYQPARDAKASRRRPRAVDHRRWVKAA